MKKRINYELTEKAFRYLLINGENKTTIQNFVDALVKDKIISRWEKIDEFNYKITFNA